MNGTMQACAICGSTIERRPEVRLGYGAIVRCNGCGSGLLEPRPSAADLGDLHGDEDYFNHPYFEARRELTPIVRAACEAKLARIEARAGSLRGKALVDVGCDLGVLVAYAEESRAMSAIGVDIIRKVVELGRAAGRDLRLGTLESVALPENSADIICGFDLIEHVDDPHRLVAEAWRVLKPGGTLALETPNFGGLIYRIGRIIGHTALLRPVTRSLQERLWPPFHVQYFTKTSLKALIEKAGYVDVVVSGRELEPAELAVANPAMRLLVRGIFAMASLVGAPTLLMAYARKPEGSTVS